jgi:hypothetical protein
MIPAESLDKATRERRADDDEREVDFAFADVRRYVIDGIEAIGGSEIAAGIVGIDRSDLRKALDERAGRGLWCRHVLQLHRRILRVNPSIAVRLGSALVSSADLEVFPRRWQTPEEELAEIKIDIERRFGEAGRQYLAERIGARR